MRVAVLGLLVGCGRIGFDPVCGVDAPCVESVTINGGAAYTGGPRLAVSAVVTGDAPPFQIRITAGPCTFADDEWQPYDPAVTYPVLGEPVDGVKQGCAWARDANAAVSPLRVGTIGLEAANVPVVDAFDVMSIDAAHLRATWTLSDVEGLAAHPVTLEIRTGSTWMPLAADIGDGATGTVDLPAPAPPYVVRLTPLDRAGNRGLAATSDVIGDPRWSIYAGSIDRDFTGAARSIAPAMSVNSSNHFTVDPFTLDAYVLHGASGIVRIDGATGRAEPFIGIAGSANLPDDGVLDASSRVQTNPNMQMGPDGMLYVATGAGVGTSAVMFQIDPKTRHCRRFLGGGTVFDQTATPSTVFLNRFAFSFDEDGALYFLTSCTPGTVPSPQRLRLLKATRQADGSAGAISIVAGNCALGSPPPGPVDATTVPLGTFTQFASLGSTAVAERGRVIYLGSAASTSGGVAEKIIDGQHYASDLAITTTGSLAIDAITGTVLVANDDVREYTLNRTGTTDPFIGVRIAQTGTGADCADDGVAASDACVHAGFNIESTADRAYFSDGMALNESRTFRVRFVDRQGRMRTYVGRKELQGDGALRRLVHGRIGGIFYKPATAPNQTAFPAGLYFADPFALVLGRIDDATGRASIVWGNQSGVPRAIATGDALGPNHGLGRGYFEATLQSLGFDPQGLPVVRYQRGEGTAGLLTADTAGHARALSTSAGTLWELAANGTNPATLDVWPFGTVNNLTVADSAVFLLGGYTGASTTATLRLLDFASMTTTRLMGTGADAYSPDTATPMNASLSGTCHDDAFICFTQLRQADNRLYFSEDNRLRYITTPLVPATATLGTLFTLTRNVRNFTFRPDGTQVYYVDGQLRCHDLSSGDPMCNDTALGPPPLVDPINAGPDQLTWKDNNTLLISTNTGQILQYTAP